MVDAGTQQEDMEQTNFPAEVKTCLQKPSDKKRKKKNKQTQKLGGVEK
jgi:hypothetical protein